MGFSNLEFFNVRGSLFIGPINVMTINLLRQIIPMS